jgi:uncharacterized protein
VATELKDAADASRFELREDGELAAFIDYEWRRERLALVHTEAVPGGRRGAVRELVAAVLDDARERGLEVLPYCPYVLKYITRHPEYIDLVPPDRRARFGLADGDEESE